MVLFRPKGEQSEQRVLPVDNVVICAGQVSVNELYEQLKDSQQVTAHLIGGAEFAGELDAKRACLTTSLILQILRWLPEAQCDQLLIPNKQKSLGASTKLTRQY